MHVKLHSHHVLGKFEEVHKNNNTVYSCIGNCKIEKQLYDASDVQSSEQSGYGLHATPDYKGVANTRKLCRVITARVCLRTLCQVGEGLVRKI